MTNLAFITIILYLKKLIKLKEPTILLFKEIFGFTTIKKNIIAKLKPENRFYPVSNNSTTEAAIHTNLLRDFYIVLGNGNINSGWIIRIYYNPLVIWIWIGAITIFFGGLFSIKNNLKIVKRLPR